jgi:hypothetical protein
MATKNATKPAKPSFTCSECGWTATKWVGRCGECQAWGTVDEARPFPTIRPGDEPIRDGHLLWTPRDLAPGRYRVALLLYRPDDARAVAPSGADGDLVALGSFDVGP